MKLWTLLHWSYLRPTEAKIVDFAAEDSWRGASNNLKVIVPAALSHVCRNSEAVVRVGNEATTWQRWWSGPILARNPRWHMTILLVVWCVSKKCVQGSVGHAHLGQMPLVETPHSMICDLVGPLSPPSEGHLFILTATDLCTRFPDAVPPIDIHTNTVAEALIGIFSHVGITQRIHSDRGSQFTSEMMSEVSRLLSIQQSTTSPYHAMGNNQRSCRELQQDDEEYVEEGCCRKT